MGADQTIVLEGGRVVETGSHAELLQAGGVYASLLHRQLLAEDVAEAGALAPADDGI
jgi:ATP-binding cassette subfamily B protein